MPSIETELLHYADDRADARGAINTPVYRASLFSFPTYQDYLDARARGPEATIYSRLSNPTRDALEAKIARLEGADHAIAFSSGMGAIAAALLAVLKAGDHLLVAACCYGPTRNLCNSLLSRMGIEVDYFDSDESSDLSGRLRPNTRAIYLESPGTFTFQIQDLRAVARIAKERNITTIVDNSWATPLYQQPIALGIDIVVHSATKYIAGHADVVAGLLACNDSHYSVIQPVAELLGACLAPDDAYLATRGLRTLPLRLEHQGAAALTIARWLQERPEVQRVLHPGLPDFPGHKLAQSQMSGNSSLFAVVMHPPAPPVAQHAFVDTLTYFSIGVSWGGFESLILPIGDSYRHAPHIRRSLGLEDETYRICIGLENIEDLIADLERGFAARAAAMIKA